MEPKLKKKIKENHMTTKETSNKLTLDICPNPSGKRKQFLYRHP
jgi:hypothetical protein